MRDPPVAREALKSVSGFETASGASRSVGPVFAGPRG